jgi:hypothetical protein
MSLRQTFVTALAVMLAGAATAAGGTSQPIPCDNIDSVGRAKMSTDGTITLQLRSLWPNPIAEAQLVYAPGDPQYEDIKHHLGGIAPGQSKPVPPLCGMNSEP